MATIILSSNETFNVGTGSTATVIGNSGTEKVLVTTGATVTTDQSVERVDLGGAAASYTYNIAGNVIKVYSAGVLVETFTAGGTNQSLAFTDGLAVVAITGLNAATIGGQAVATAAASPTGAALPAAPTLAIGAGNVSGVTAGGSVPATGGTFALTASVSTPDAPVLTTGNDTITGANGTLQSTDRLLDPSVSDTDTLTASVAGYTAAAVIPAIINVENININGLYNVTGFDATNVVGTKDLTLNTDVSGTATVTDVAATKVATVTAGANIGTLNVTALAAGTGGSVTVNGASTLTVVTGGVKADNFTINLPASSGVTLTEGPAGTAGDSATLNLAGGNHAYTNTTASNIENLTLNSITAANTVTLQTVAALTGVATGNGIVIGGDKALIISGDLDNISGAAIGTDVVINKAAGAGVVTFDASAITTAATPFINRAAIDIVKLDVGTVSALTVNQATTIALNATQVAAVFDVGDNTSTALALGTGTLNLNIVTGAQTSIQTGAAVGTLNITANAAAVTIATLDTNTLATGVDAVVMTGSKAVTITTWTHTAGDIITATGLTGILTLAAVATGIVDSVIIGGTANDAITFGALTGTTSVARGGAGNDTLTATLATLGSSVSLYGDAGDDIITGGIGADILNGGDGNDILIRTAATPGADTMTGGAGNDKFVVDALTAAVITQVASITDFTAGVDKILLLSTNTVAATVLKNVTVLTVAQQATVDATADVFAAAAKVWTNMSAYSGSTYTEAVNDVVEFVYKGNTYAYVDVSGAMVSGALATTDTLIKITGVTGAVTAGDFLVS